MIKLSLSILLALIFIGCGNNQDSKLLNRDHSMMPRFTENGPFPKINRLANTYITVAVSGFLTGKPEGHGLTSNTIDSSNGKEPSGVWSRLPSYHNRISYALYLEHDDGSHGISEVMKYFMNGQNCNEEIGIIIMANSWGSTLAVELAEKYTQTCGWLPDLFVMVDGVAKPIGAFSDEVPAYNCVNYFQDETIGIHGGPLENCKNIQLYRGQGGGINTHIEAEWSGASSGAYLIRQYLSGRLDVDFVQQQTGIDPNDVNVQMQRKK